MRNQRKWNFSSNKILGLSFNVYNRCSPRTFVVMMMLYSSPVYNANAEILTVSDWLVTLNTREISLVDPLILENWTVAHAEGIIKLK